MKDRVTLTIERNLLHQLDSRVDGNTIKNRSHAVEMILRQSLKGGAPTKAVILAGGSTTTFSGPKALLEVDGTPLIVHNIKLLKQFNVTTILVSIGPGGDRIQQVLGDGGRWGVTINYLEETQPELGTGGPLKAAAAILGNESFIVTNADDLKEINILKCYERHIHNNALVTIALTTTADTSTYGSTLLDGERIIRFLEKEPSESSHIINAGFYVMEPEVLKMLPDGYSMLEVDLFPKLASTGKLYGYLFPGRWASPRSQEELARLHWPR